MTRVKTLSWLAAVALTCGMSIPAQAEKIAVGNFGVSANGMPYAVALDKGFFKAEGITVDGIITSAGGGTSLRNMIAGGVPYGEVNPGVVVAAIMQGADLRIISDNVLTVAEFVWAVKPDSPIKTLADIKGKKKLALLIRAQQAKHLRRWLHRKRVCSQVTLNLFVQAALVKVMQRLEPV